MHLNYNLGIRPKSHSSSQKVPPLYEYLGSIPGFVSIYIIFYFCLRLIYLLLYNYFQIFNI